MIVLTLKRNDPRSIRIKERLDELVLAYKTEYAGDESSPSPPSINENGTIIHGEQEIENWLAELKQELDWQRSLSGDGCYIDPDTGDAC